MTKQRVVRRAVTAAAGLLMLVAALPDAAGALDADPITAQPGQPVSVEYGPIPGNDPATTQALGPVAPDTCQLSPACNLIPLEFVAPPGFRPEDDTYLAELVLSWEATAIGDRNVGAASNDLDLYVWAAEYLETDPGEACYVPDPAPEGFKAPEYCTTNLARSAGPLPPERVRFDVTSHRRYLLVVNNATGANLGYKIEITSRFDRFVEPKGVGDTDFAIPPAGSDTPSSSSFGGGGGAATFNDLSPAQGVGGTELGLEPFPADADSELASLEGATLPGANFLRRPTASTGPAKPVSGATVVLWLALLPIVLGSAAAYWFVRRRPSALRVSFPTTKAA